MIQHNADLNSENDIRDYSHAKASAGTINSLSAPQPDSATAFFMNKIALAKRLQDTGWGANESNECLSDNDPIFSMEYESGFFHNANSTTGVVVNDKSIPNVHPLIQKERSEESLDFIPTDNEVDMRLSSICYSPTKALQVPEQCPWKGPDDLGPPTTIPVSMKSSLCDTEILPASPRPLVCESTPIRPITTNSTMLKSGPTTSTPIKPFASAFSSLLSSPSHTKSFMQEPSPLVSTFKSSAFHSPKPHPSPSTRSRDSLSGAAHPPSFYLAPPRIIEVSPSLRKSGKLIPELTTTILDASARKIDYDGMHHPLENHSTPMLLPPVKDISGPHVQENHNEHKSSAAILSSPSRLLSRSSGRRSPTADISSRSYSRFVQDSNPLKHSVGDSLASFMPSSTKTGTGRRSPAADTFASFVVSTVRAMSPALPYEQLVKPSPVGTARSSYGMLKSRSQSPMFSTTAAHDDISPSRIMSPFELAVEQFRKAHNLTPQDSPPYDRIIRQNSEAIISSRSSICQDSYHPTVTYAPNARKRCYDSESNDIHTITSNLTNETSGITRRLNSSEQPVEFHSDHVNNSSEKLISVSTATGARSSQMGAGRKNEVNSAYTYEVDGDRNRNKLVRLEQLQATTSDHIQAHYSHGTREQQLQKLTARRVIRVAESTDQEAYCEDESYVDSSRLEGYQERGGVVSPTFDVSKGSIYSQHDAPSQPQSKCLIVNRNAHGHPGNTDSSLSVDGHGVENDSKVVVRLRSDEKEFHGDGSDVGVSDGARGMSEAKKESKRLTKGSSKSSACTCRKTRCLKLYCDCFSARTYCRGCFCFNCANTPALEPERENAVRAICERNPSAFSQHDEQQRQQQQYVTQPAISRPRPTNPPPAEPRGTLKLTSSELKLTAAALASGGKFAGCNCRKSACLKKYCECYQGEAACTSNCHCYGCQNNVELQESRRNKVIEWSSRD